ncbi:MAG: hypothetical protein RL338_744 [Chloroflexota bacterium]|jgi:curved DNA-binding protein
MEYKDYYRTLGVPKTATAAEIKRAYRALAREHHPDLRPGDPAAEARFKDVNEAHEVLSDPEKRRRYDTLGANWEELSRSRGGGPFAGFGGFPGAAGGTGPGGVRFEFRTGGDASGFSDFFRAFFGGEAAGSGGASIDELLAGLGGRGGGAGGRGEAGGRRGGGRRAPVEASVDVTLEEAFHGTSRIVELDGKRLEVRVPPGVDDGSRVRLRGQGGGDGAAARDLDLVTRLLPNAVFTRKGADLSRDLTIELGEAMLGGEVRVPTIGGAVLLRIPPGTQPGRTFRLAGQGMPRLTGSGRGDLLVRIGVRIPTLHDDAERRAAEAFLAAVGGAGATR